MPALCQKAWCWSFEPALEPSLEASLQTLPPFDLPSSLPPNPPSNPPSNIPFNTPSQTPCNPASLQSSLPPSFHTLPLTSLLSLPQVRGAGAAFLREVEAVSTTQELEAPCPVRPPPPTQQHWLTLVANTSHLFPGVKGGPSSPRTDSARRGGQARLEGDSGTVMQLRT